MNLINELLIIYKKIKTDFGGGSPLDKTYLMAYLILKNNLKTYVEIGVYRGKSLFTAAISIKKNFGMAYGIDPYKKDSAREYDIEKSLQEKIDEFIGNTDFEEIYNDVMNLRSDLELTNNLELIRETSEEAVEIFRKSNIKIDMIHIDGNHDTKYVMKDVELYLPLLSKNSIIIMDDIDWDSVKPAYELLKKSTTVLFETNFYAILINRAISENELKEYVFDINCVYDLLNKIIEIGVDISNLNSKLPISKDEVPY